MEPLTLAATAIAATIITKVWEKTGEKLGEKLFDASEKFLASLGKKSPATLTAIEKARTQPLDYGQAVLEVEAIIQQDNDVATAAKSLVAVAEAEQNPQLIALAKEVAANIKSQETPEQKVSKLADTIQKIGMVAINSPISIQSFHMD